MQPNALASRKGLDVVHCRFGWLKNAMHAHVQEPFGSIVPTLRYRDVAAAIDWLCNAFGFERHLVVPGEDGAVRYAELTLGGGMIMLGPVADSAFDMLMTQPQQTGGAETQICYLFVEDAGAHCARAKAAGAEIVLDIEEADGGGRGYSCRDPEGHIWNFGTYNPWKRQAAAQAAQADKAGLSDRRFGGSARGLGRAVLVSGLLVAVAASAVVVAWALGTSERIGGEFEPVAAAGAPTDATARSEQELLAHERSAKEAAERAAKDMQAQVARERSALEAAQRIAREAQERLSLAERAAGAVQEELAAERSARLAGQKALEELVRERDAKGSMERAKQEEREKLAKEAAAKEARERQQRTARRPVLREQPEPITPYTIWPK